MKAWLFFLFMANNKTQFFFISILILVFLLLNATPSYACSAAPDFDKYKEADVIVSGQIINWQKIGVPNSGGFITIQVNLVVDHVLKGKLSSQNISFFDKTSLKTAGVYESWVGSGGTCGLFDNDPKNTKIIIGLIQENETYKSNRLMLFYLAESNDEYYKKISDELALKSKILLPVTGQSQN